MWILTSRINTHGPAGAQIPRVQNSLNPLNAELNPICHLLALLGADHILHVSRIKVNATAVGALQPYWRQSVTLPGCIESTHGETLTEVHTGG